MKWLSTIITKVAFPSMDSPIPVISPEEARNTCNMSIGSIYHGTSSKDSINSILNTGFRWEEGEIGGPNTANGYFNKDYFEGCPAPVHHLGYGIYFTQSKTIAKRFGHNSMKNVAEFYILNNARIEVINFGSNKTMMKWWNKNGYDCNVAKINRVQATKELTNNLRTKYDAVLFTGKGLFTLLDGNQICVYNPSILRRVDKSLAKPGEIGSKVKRLSDGMIGRLISRRINPMNNEEYFSIKWTKGGSDLNVLSRDVEFVR